MNFNDLVDIVAKLRGPDGCPWDREQTRDSLRKYLVEEFYELIDALEDNDYDGMREEMGDLLFQIVLQSQLSKEEGRFDIDDVVADIAGKMVHRHPHVFGGRNFNTSDDVVEWWEESKKIEGKNHDSAIGGVPRSLPALLRARKIQMKATKVGFDWEKIEDVFEKLHEEIGELKEAIRERKRKDIEDELGDMFFVLVRIANFVDVDPEDALRGTIKKFDKRFRHIEAAAARQGRKISDMTLAEMEVYWQEAKNK
ncbi:MAG: nucleoside triphosphate pyrophosphohydrolase [Nitrospirota bacterium]